MAQSDFLDGGARWKTRKKKKKKKKKKKRETVSDERGQQNRRTGNPILQDPFEVLGSDLLMIILSYLDARSVALSLLVSRSWYAVASSDRLWSSKCLELWLGKAHIPRLAQSRGLPKLAAYSLSIMDGKRTRIMREDLCDHAWQFHFNKEAPVYWRDLDPYWQGSHPLMRRYFHPDGSQTADPDDRVWGGHESCFSTVTSFVGDGEIREHYVRINRWPRMFVSRNEDWSWRMSNHFTSYSSIADPDKAGGTGPL
ncbi:uncharacterized protein LOC103483521 isoform X1 [Cucumis melo]|uniref:Uncharacterized protein LOC103483521 isoform X1 n=1 Tax=Cucumis melo TaxID=3656 RepID=A0A1S3AWZ4_CUCME|nr:uncharacterized protein LOC103483521 isoform X1 [Cucumis melo]